MEVILEICAPLIPWILLIFIVMIFNRLFFWAKNRKTGALVFGILTQMFMPDPFVERTIKVVQEDKKKTIQEEDENGAPHQ